MYIAVLEKVVELIDKYVVNENDRKRLITEIELLDRKCEESVKKGLKGLSSMKEH